MTLPSHSLALWEPSTVPIDPPALNLSLITGPAANTAGTVPGAMGNDAIANLFFTGGAAAGAVPLEYIGGGGTGMGIVGGVPVTIVGAVWTNLGVTSPTDVRTVMIATTAAGIPMTVTASAFDNRQHGNGRGTVQLVAPAFAKIFGGVLGTLPVIGVLTIDVPTPEPGTLLWWAAASWGSPAWGDGSDGRASSARSFAIRVRREHSGPPATAQPAPFSVPFRRRELLGPGSVHRRAGTPLRRLPLGENRHSS